MTAAETVLADRDAIERGDDRARAGLPRTRSSRPTRAPRRAADLTTLDGADRDLDQGRGGGPHGTRRAGRRASDRSVSVGLLGARSRTPAYSAALAAFAAGDERARSPGSSATVAALAGAEEIGRGRTLAVGAAVGRSSCSCCCWSLWLLLRDPPAAARGGLDAGGVHGRTGRSQVGRRDRADVDGSHPADPYATLAATPDPLEDPAGRDSGAEPD